VLQDVPEEARMIEIEAESSLRGHLKGEGGEEAGSQSYVPADEKDDKALVMALELLRGTKTNPAFPPNPKSAHLPN
jgi:carboxyl-terminal processing protease